MAVRRSKKWRRDRAWLRHRLKEACGAADWPAEKLAAVEERLSKILLKTLAAPQSEREPHFVGYEACEVMLAMEAAKQERELAELRAGGKQLDVRVGN